MKGALAKEPHQVGSAAFAVTQKGCAGAMTRAERTLADVLADVLCVDHLSADSHFFDELGADSLVMAKFCARVRKRGDLPSVSMRDIYQHPTIRSLAAALAIRAQLGHASGLHSGQAVPAAEWWHGSPAQHTDVNYVRAPPVRSSFRVREHFEGPRELLVAMADAVRLADCSPTIDITGS